ncbi:hypothetical protein FPV67DRAFT_1453295 [Lyophyllum atratum]|nr:hypothetical protein FPV67DRAFT_1453295 [Lyophyllum atratum]
MTDFSTFKAQFKGDLVVPTDTDYPQAITRWAVNAKRRAAVVAFVKDAADVVIAIQYARAQALPIAICGGGHSPAGASSSEGGLVIDLSRYIDAATIDPMARLAYVGGGALWAAVDQAAIQHGLATVAGTVNHTGVGGLTLGGGYGWLSSQHGMVVDNLVQATVVTADGSILTANDYVHSDLFFGIRGGGSNFGVVTEFVYRLHRQRPTVYAGMLAFPPSVLEKLIEVTGTWWENAGQKEAMIQVLGPGPDGNPALVMIVFFNGSEAEGRANFKAFLDLGPVVDQTKEVPYEELNGLQNFFTYHGQGVYMKGVAQKKPDYPSAAKAIEKAISLSTPDFKASIIYEYFPLAKISSMPKDLTAFRRDPTPGVLLSCVWKEDLKGYTERARGVVHELARIVTGAHPEMTETEGLGYSNYDHEAVTGEKETVPDKARLVFAENYPRLQGIKKRYDPQNVFNKWFPITPA